MKKTAYIVISIMLWALAGCSPKAETELSTISATETTCEESIEANTPVYASDYEVLWDALHNTYPYLSYLQSQGIDTDEIYSRYKTKVETITDEDFFYDMLQSMLAEMHNFAHLQVITPEEYEDYYYVNVGYMTDLGEENPYYIVLTDPSLSKRYQPSKNVENAFRNNSSDADAQIFTQYYTDCNALYLKIPSFGSRMVIRDQDLLFEKLKEYPETKHVIIDISGNPGGYGSYWINNLVAPFGETYKFGIRTFYKSSQLVEFYHPGWDIRALSELEDAPEWADDMGLDLYLDYTYSMSDIECKTLPNAKNIKRWVLISRSSYSAAETFACFCKTTGFATLVGAQTSGDGMHTSPILLLLPDSGILIRMSDGVGENPDGSINAIHGTTPDITCKKGETPLGRCLDEIKKQTE